MQLGHTKQSHRIRTFLIGLIKTGRTDIVRTACVHFDISRQMVNRHLAKLVEMGFLVAEGATKKRIYKLGWHRFFSAVYNLSSISEDTVYRQDFEFIFNDTPKKIDEICHYGFTEMLNNAIDHSEGTEVFISAERTENKIDITIIDDGEGIFVRIARLLGLTDPRDSLHELYKGKLTTDPDNHSGEGIFFTSRSFDDFFISAGDLSFSHNHQRTHDYLLHTAADDFKGTLVSMEISLESTRELNEVFKKFTTSDEKEGLGAFDKTIVPVRLVVYEGERLVSRSQARRLLTRIDRFRHVIFDFEGVETVGQGFADEVFRVFATKQPDIELVPVNMTADVRRMVVRAVSNRAAQHP